MTCRFGERMHMKGLSANSHSSEIERGDDVIQWDGL